MRLVTLILVVGIAACVSAVPVQRYKRNAGYSYGQAAPPPQAAPAHAAAAPVGAAPVAAGGVAGGVAAAGSVGVVTPGLGGPGFGFGFAPGLFGLGGIGGVGGMGGLGALGILPGFLRLLTITFFITHKFLIKVSKIHIYSSFLGLLDCFFLGI